MKLNICDKSCRNRTDTILTGYDVFRLARHFGCLTGDILQSCCKWMPDKETKLPVVQLVPHDSSCPLLQYIKNWSSGDETAESKAAAEAWADATSKIAPVLQRISKINPDDFELSFNTAFASLYWMYSTNEDFAERCRINTETFLGYNFMGQNFS